MNIQVNVNELLIVEQDSLNSGEYNIHDCNFEFSSEYDGLVKKAVFSNNEHSYQVLLANDSCVIPYEILENDGIIEIGLYAYQVDNENLILRYSPKPVTKHINTGSYREHYDNYEEVTSTDKEQMEQMLSNINITAEKVDTTTTISITNKDGITSTTEILDGIDGIDGVGLNYNWDGTSLGVKREDETNYQYVNLKGEKGDPRSNKNDYCK